jgi:hypothetical protein
MQHALLKLIIQDHEQEGHALAVPPLAVMGFFRPDMLLDECISTCPTHLNRGGLNWSKTK